MHLASSTSTIHDICGCRILQEWDASLLKLIFELLTAPRSPQLSSQSSVPHVHRTKRVRECRRGRHRGKRGHTKRRTRSLTDMNPKGLQEETQGWRVRRVRWGPDIWTSHTSSSSISHVGFQSSAVEEGPWCGASLVDTMRTRRRMERARSRCSDAEMPLSQIDVDVA